MKTKKLDFGGSLSSNIKWVLDFAQADLQTWQDKDWIDADYGLKMFCRPFIRWLRLPQLIQKGMSRQYDFSRVKEWLSYIQPAVKKFTDRLMRAKTLEIDCEEIIKVPYEGTIFYDFVDGRLTLGTRLEKFPQDPQKKKAVFKATFLLLLAECFSRLDVSRLKTCPECGKYFLSTGKQQFDTPQCSTRQRVAKFLSKQKTRKAGGAQTKPKGRAKRVNPPQA